MNDRELDDAIHFPTLTVPVSPRHRSGFLNFFRRRKIEKDMPSGAAITCHNLSPSYPLTHVGASHTGDDSHRQFRNHPSAGDNYAPSTGDIPTSPNHTQSTISIVGKSGSVDAAKGALSGDAAAVNTVGKKILDENTVATPGISISAPHIQDMFEVGRA
jgi:hypothetical protein